MRPADAFTLPELLVASLIAALIAVITAQVMISQLREEGRLEAAQRNREDFSRLNYLLQIEASEAEQIEVGASPPGCTIPGGFTLWIPRPDDVYGPSINRSGVQYVNSSGGIVRCGPRVFRNGTLDHPPLLVGSDGSVSVGADGVVSGLVVPNASITVLNPPLQPAKQISYQVDFVNGNLGIAGALEPVTLHAKSIFVCNPSIGSGGGIGDCQ
ncbi:prepilin-type N-terminal cleavage/methylation domain-containing protein [Cyanobium sp. CH-040]|nr:prepilin-type N-terminal cleavage/methylation domain-containing protein [Cyanobium sp. CH-040]